MRTRLLTESRNGSASECAGATTDYEELCARNDIDVVTIVTPDVFHAGRPRLPWLLGSMSYVKSRWGLAPAKPFRCFSQQNKVSGSIRWHLPIGICMVFRN